MELFTRRPGGVVTTAELRRAGCSYDTIARLHDDGVLRRLLHGTYVLADVPEPPERCVALPIRYLSQRRPEGHRPAVVSGTAGLALHDRGPFALPHVNPLVLVDPECRLRPAHVPWTTVRAEQPASPVSVRGVPTAPPLRCLADAAGEKGVTDKALRLSVDDLRGADRLLMPDIVDGWRASRGLGVNRLERMLEEGQFEQESEGERRVFQTVFVPHPPLPDCQVVVGRYRVDFIFISAALIVEYYGLGTHAHRVDADAVRIHALEALGYRVIVVTRSMLKRPGPLAAHITLIRRDREQRIARGELPAPPLPTQPRRVAPLRTLYPLG